MGVGLCAYCLSIHYYMLIQELGQENFPTRYSFELFSSKINILIPISAVI